MYKNTMLNTILKILLELNRHTGIEKTSLKRVGKIFVDTKLKRNKGELVSGSNPLAGNQQVLKVQIWHDSPASEVSDLPGTQPYWGGPGSYFTPHTVTKANDHIVPT